MNENIDLVKILKDCPKGTKFYSYIYGEETYFQGLSLYRGNPVAISIYGEYGEGQNFSLSPKGHPYSDECGECCIFPSREMRDWSKFTAPWHKNEKFDFLEFYPYQKVLVRDGDKFPWDIDYLSHIDTRISHSYITATSAYIYCIPYNDDTKHLVGTKEEAPEFYRY